MILFHSIIYGNMHSLLRMNCTAVSVSLVPGALYVGQQLISAAGEKVPAGESAAETGAHPGVVQRGKCLLN